MSDPVEAGSLWRGGSRARAREGASDSGGHGSGGSVLRHPTMRALVAIGFFTYVAQNMLNVSIAPLARALGLVEWAVGLAVSLAAVAVTLLSQFWGRRSTHWGRRRVMLTALVLALVAGTLFSGIVWARAAGLVGAVAATVCIIVARGPFFGGAVAAIPPTCQALIAEVTPDELSRVRGMAAYSGAVNLSVMVGSLVSSALGAWWIFAPVHATPWFVVVALVVAWRWIPRTPPAEARALPPKVAWTDRRLLPWIAAGFGTFFTGGVIQITVGFVAQDRLALGPQEAMPVTGGLLLAVACGAMLAQWVVIPRLRLTPTRLVRTGLIGMMLAVALLLVAGEVWSLGAACVLSGAAQGFVGTGYNAGGSLAVRREELGGVAGVLNAASAVTWIFAPVMATSLYGAHPLAPFLLCVELLGVSLAVALFHPSMRINAGGRSLARSDGGE